MNKAEFLEILREQLSGQMQEGRIAAHVQYYRDYIDSQLRDGREEMSVLAELGDPRLIAKTLLDTNAEAGQEIYENSGSYQGYSGSGNAQGGYVKKHTYKLNLSTWYGKLIVILAAALVMIGLVIVIGTILPIVVVVGVIVYIISRFWRS